MNSTYTTGPSHSHDDEIDLRELFGVFWRGKVQIVLVTALFALLGILYALYLPNVYRSEALLAPAQEQDSLAGAMQGLSGLAGLAGISLPEASGSQSDQAVEVLSSRSFFTEKIYPSIHLPDLMADPRWDPETNTLSYDDDLYDAGRGQWVREVDFPYQVTPTAQEAHDFFIENTLNVSSDNATGFVTLSVDHVSPYIARDWAELMILEINEQFRARDHEIAMSSIAYLNNQIAITSVVEVRQALSQLLQNQIQTSMLTDANPDYVYSVIDPPVPPELKDSPGRVLIVILATLLGGMIGVVDVLVRHSWAGTKIR
ncbi:MAG: Wzz/FepE/Etk N-terminal domain-containing protein [Betaproteobacteria bacterium]